VTQPLPPGTPATWTELAAPGAARIELVCRACGYGAVAAAAPPHCPMCHGSSWQVGREQPDADADLGRFA
jgi:hypothetical protein